MNKAYDYLSVIDLYTMLYANQAHSIDDWLVEFDNVRPFMANVPASVASEHSPLGEQMASYMARNAYAANLVISFAHSRLKTLNELLKTAKPDSKPSYRVTSEMPSSVATEATDRFIGGNSFFKTAALRSSE